MLFVGQMLMSVVNRSTSSRRSRQNPRSSRPGRCFVLFFGRAGDACVPLRRPRQVSSAAAVERVPIGSANAD
jgi:hypothetical protein